MSEAKTSGAGWDNPLPSGGGEEKPLDIIERVMRHPVRFEDGGVERCLTLDEAAALIRRVTMWCAFTCMTWEDMARHVAWSHPSFAENESEESKR